MGIMLMGKKSLEEKFTEVNHKEVMRKMKKPEMLKAKYHEKSNCSSGKRKRCQNCYI